MPFCSSHRCWLCLLYVLLWPLSVTDWHCTCKLFPILSWLFPHSCHFSMCTSTDIILSCLSILLTGRSTIQLFLICWCCFNWGNKTAFRSCRPTHFLFCCWLFILQSGFSFCSFSSLTLHRNLMLLSCKLSLRPFTPSCFTYSTFFSTFTLTICIYLCRPP